MSKTRPSFQEALKSRQLKKLREDFIGRTDELSRFARGLELSAEDRTMIFNISGQGGMGKTYLLRRCRHLAEEQGALTAWSDEAEQSVIDVMARLAGELRGRAAPMKAFTQRHKQYEERRQELLAATNAPKDLPAFLNKSIRAGIKLARSAPAVGPVFELLDEDSVSAWMGDASEFIASRFQDKKDDIRLLRDPIGVLTPLLLEDLFALPDDRLLAFFFDTYESTCAYLDAWLKGLLSAAYGSVPANILLCIAGQSELEREGWAPFEEALSRVALNPFTRDEVRIYLHQRGILSESFAEEIHEKSEGHPLQVALLAAAQPGTSGPPVNPNDTVAQRFLKSISNPLQRQWAMNSALPRWFNQDTLAALHGAQEDDSLFTWLKGMPFVQSRGDEGGWKYHSIVRTQFLKDVQHQSPGQWKRLHGQLGTYYEHLCESLQPPGTVPHHSPRWRVYALEALYHRLCEGSGSSVSRALSGFLSALKVEHEFAQAWVGTLSDAERDCLFPPEEGLGARLTRTLEALGEKRFLDATEGFTLLLEREDLPDEARAAALNWRGGLFQLVPRREEALRDLSAAVDLAPESAEYLRDLAQAHGSVERFEEAIALCDRLLRMDSEDVSALVIRGMCLASMGNLPQALANFSQALSRSPPDAASIHVLRAVLHVRQREFDLALADIERAAVLAPERAAIRMVRLDILMAKGDLTLAAQSAMELDALAEAAARELGSAQFGSLNASEDNELRDIHQAIGANPDLARMLGNELIQKAAEGPVEGARVIQAIARSVLAEQHFREGRLSEALALARQTTELVPSVVNFWLLRTRYADEADDDEDLLVCLDQLERFSPEVASANAGRRGLALAILGRSEEALAQYRRALAHEPDNVVTLYNLAVAASRLHGPENARDEIDAARHALQALDEESLVSLVFYGLGGLKAVEGHPDEALELLYSAVKAQFKAASLARRDPAWSELREDLRFRVILDAS